MIIFGHMLLSLMLYIFLYPYLGSIIILPLIAVVFIDIDHLYWFYQCKVCTPKKFKAFIKKIYITKETEAKKDLWKETFFLFHTLEFSLLLIILGILFSFTLLLVSFGFIFHIATDLIHHAIYGFPLRRWLFLTNFILKK